LHKNLNHEKENLHFFLITTSFIASCNYDYGCTDPESINFGFYDKHDQSMCEYPKIYELLEGNYSSSLHLNYSVNCTSSDSIYDEELNHEVVISAIDTDTLNINNLFNQNENITAYIINDTIKINEQLYNGNPFTAIEGVLIPKTDLKSINLSYVVSKVGCGILVNGDLYKK